VIRPRMTVRARMTLLYSVLFAACGAIVITVSYILVAQLKVLGLGRTPSASELTNFLARCSSESSNTNPSSALLSKCNSALKVLGALQQRHLTLSHLLTYSLVTLTVVLALAAILGWVISGRSLRPIQLITAAARAASEDNLSARVATSGPRDELRELAETFDEMLGRLQAAFEAQQQFIANASHELRTPLAFMRTTVDVVLDNVDSTIIELREMGGDVRLEVDHAEQLIGALLTLARTERLLRTSEAVDLATVTEDVLDNFDVGDRLVHVSLKPSVISGDALLAERLIANLIDNAVRYNVAAGDIWISTDDADGSIQFSIVNTGPLISEDDADRIFQPFLQLNGRTSQQGFGLGLAIVASIVQTHGGKVAARPRNDGGLSVTVSIPAALTDSSAAGIVSRAQN
jgi:signal transduction histidine kinase